MQNPIPGPRGLAADWWRVAEDHADAPPAVQAWAAGWVAQACGRYAEALGLLDEAETGEPLVQAAAGATLAALLRQIGLHDRAEEVDAAAMATLAVCASGPAREDVAAGLAIGAVADAVGRGDSDALWPRLDAAAAAVETAGPRQRVRLGWVTGEVALMHDDPGGATRALTASAERAAAAGWPRHEGKSLIFLAAALTQAGARASAHEHALRGLTLAERTGARPLVWPAHLVLAPLGPLEEVPRRRNAAAEVLDGLLATLPRELETEARAAPDARALLEY